jgi:hypothetical protein
MNNYTVILKSISSDEISHEYVKALNPAQACVVAACKFYPDAPEDEDWNPLDSVVIFDVLEGYIKSALPPIILKTIPKEDCPTYIGLCPSLDYYISKQLRGV